MATDLAGLAGPQGRLPFRQAHHDREAGRHRRRQGVDLDKLTLAEMQAVEPKIDRGVFGC